MAFDIGKPKVLFLIVVLFGIGIIAVEFLHQSIICSYVQKEHYFRQSLTDDVNKPQNTNFKQITSAKQEPKYLKVPRNLDFSCWLNPCENKQQEVKWKMIFFVKSAIDHGFAREMLRRTWAKVSYLEGYQFSSVFLLGKTDEAAKQSLIDDEYETYGDILQLNLVDEYRFIAQKTLRGMEWANENLSDEVFYTSCDDDFVIDFAELVGVMNKYQNQVKNELWHSFPIICGHKARFNDTPHRMNASRYYVTKKEYKWPYYPDYCLGGAYTTSVGVVRQLWMASRGADPLKMDDVWITGLLREKIGMPRQYVRRLDQPVAFHYGGFSHKRETTCIKMQKEWNLLQKKFENLTFCYCSVL